MTAQPAFREQLRQAAMLTAGAIVGGASYAIAGWVVGMFAATLPIPPGTHLGVSVALFFAGVYYVVFDTNDDGQTMLNGMLGRLEA